MLIDLIKSGRITAHEIAELPRLIELAQLTERAVDGARKKITFNLGEQTVKCYDRWGVGMEAHSWALCDKDGNVRFYTNWGGDHMTLCFNITDENPFSTIVSTVEEKKEGSFDLLEFLKEMSE